jgi:hypothetical protein
VLWHHLEWLVPTSWRWCWQCKTCNIRSLHRYVTELPCARVGILQPWPPNSVAPARQGNSSHCENLDECSVVDVWTTRYLMDRGSSGPAWSDLSAGYYSSGDTSRAQLSYSSEDYHQIGAEQNRRNCSNNSRDDTASTRVFVFQSTSMYTKGWRSS